MVIFAFVAALCAHAALGIGIYDDSVGGRTILVTLGSSLLLVYAWQNWREERNETERDWVQYWPLAAFLVAPVVYVGLLAVAESNDNDALEDVVALAEATCSDLVSPSTIVRVDVVEIEGRAIAVFEPPRGNPDDVNLPAFAERAINQQTGQLRPTSVLCMSYPSRSGPLWCTQRSYDLRSAGSQASSEGTAIVSPVSQDWETVDSQRFCEFVIEEASSSAMVELVKVAAAADQPLEIVGQ